MNYLADVLILFMFVDGVAERQGVLENDRIIKVMQTSIYPIVEQD